MSLRNLATRLSQCFVFSLLLVGSQERPPAHKKPVPVVCKGSVSEQVEKEKQRGTD